MREPLYKAKAINRPPKGTYRTDYENGDWVYGLVSRLWKFRDERFAEMTNTDGVERIDVDPETICEYTGLTDRNSNEIFEGDIVKITDKLVNGVYYARVEFGNPNGQYNWGFQLVPLCKTPFAVDILHWVDMEESGAFIEVICNIYDNPELLKSEVTKMSSNDKFWIKSCSISDTNFRSHLQTTPNELITARLGQQNQNQGNTSRVKAEE